MAFHKPRVSAGHFGDWRLWDVWETQSQRPTDLTSKSKIYLEPPKKHCQSPINNLSSEGEFEKMWKDMRVFEIEYTILK